MAAINEKRSNGSDPFEGSYTDNDIRKKTGYARAERYRIETEAAFKAQKTMFTWGFEDRDIADIDNRRFAPRRKPGRFPSYSLNSSRHDKPCTPLSPWVELVSQSLQPNIVIITISIDIGSFGMVRATATYFGHNSSKLLLWSLVGPHTV